MYHYFTAPANIALGFFVTTGFLLAGVSRFVTAFVAAPPSALRCDRSRQDEIKLRSSGMFGSTTTAPALQSSMPTRHRRYLSSKNADGFQSSLCLSSGLGASLSVTRDPARGSLVASETQRCRYRSLAQALTRRRRPVRPCCGTSSSGDMADDSEETTKRNDIMNQYVEERMGINSLITYFATTPVERWTPDKLDAQRANLLIGKLYSQTMKERMAKVSSGEDMRRLEEVDTFLTGYLKKEKRNASRKKVSAILTAAAAGGTLLDDCMKEMMTMEVLDKDLDQYLGDLVRAEVDKGKKGSDLYKVLKAVKDRVSAELQMIDRPEIRTLAQALQVEARDDRKEFLQGAFRRLEDIDNFVLFMEDAMGFVGTDFRFSVRTNMPAAQLDRMKEIAEDAINLRRQYLG